MLSRAILELAGEDGTNAAWEGIFRHYNRDHGKGDISYRSGEKIVIKVNFVGCIWRSRRDNPNEYDLKESADYMNTSPQMILALLRQLIDTVGVNESDIAVGDTLAYFPNEYYRLLSAEFPNVQYLDHHGFHGRLGTKESSVPVCWSSRPEGFRRDFVPASFVRADYLINMANLKSHKNAGVTLCAKNHFGSLVRWPLQEGYWDMHESAFASGMGKYRNLVDLMGHTHIGGKTVLYLIDGLYAGRHGEDQAPLRWHSSPFDGGWTASLFASQDPVAIDSVAFDFIKHEWDGSPRKSGAEDYLHEAAQANDPPSETFYSPDHSGKAGQLKSLGVHEHWNNPQEKLYSRNLETGDGIELLHRRARS
jgi:hypothetical protein